MVTNLKTSLVPLFFLIIVGCSTNKGIIQPIETCNGSVTQKLKSGLFLQESSNQDASQCFLSCPTGYAFDLGQSNTTPNGNCFLVGELSNCSRVTHPETCGLVGCVAVSETECESPADIDNTCQQILTQSSCSNTPGCSWNISLSLCGSSLNSTYCSKFSNESDCGIECFWNEFAQKCQSEAAACSDFQDSVECNKTNICVWRKNQTCGTAQTSCIDRGDKPTCEASEGCVWDASSSQCLSSLTSSCSEAKSSGACENIAGCTWDQTGICVFKYSRCSTFFNSELCSNQGCVWDEGQGCLSKSTFQTCGSATQQSSCNSLNCYWEAESNDCWSKETPCFLIDNMNTCQNLSCVWSNNVCYSPNTFCTTANTDKDLCDKLEGCTFANGVCTSSSSCAPLTTKETCQANEACRYASSIDNAPKCITSLWCYLPTWLGGITCD